MLFASSVDVVTDRSYNGIGNDSQGGKKTMTKKQMSEQMDKYVFDYDVKIKNLYLEVDRLKRYEMAWRDMVPAVSDYFGGEFLIRNIEIRNGIGRNEK